MMRIDHDQITSQLPWKSLEVSGLAAGSAEGSLMVGCSKGIRSGYIFFDLETGYFLLLPSPQICSELISGLHLCDEALSFLHQYHLMQQGQARWEKWVRRRTDRPFLCTCINKCTEDAESRDCC